MESLYYLQEVYKMVKSTFVSIPDLVESLKGNPRIVAMDCKYDHIRFILSGYNGIFEVPYFDLEDFVECFGLLPEEHNET